MEMRVPKQVTGAPLLFVHGAWHGAWCWENWAGAVTEAGHPAYMINLPGHDRPGSTKRIWPRLERFIEAVDAALDEIGPECVLVGHSLGGLVAQKINERRRLPLVVLVCAVPMSGVLSSTVKFAACHPLSLLKVAATANTWPIMDTPEKAADVFFSPHTPMSVVEASYSKLCNDSFPAFMEMFVRRPKPARALSPVQVMAGELDELFPLEGQLKLARAYGVEPYIVRGSGHSIMIEAAWREGVDVLLDWVRRATGTPVKQAEHAVA